MDHFNIPKLELLQKFSQAVTQVGALIQYTADVSERLLITHCKDPFRDTNKQAFEEQIARTLDRREKVRAFDLYTLLRSRGKSLVNAITAEEAVMADNHPESSWISRVLHGEEIQLQAPRLMRNLFSEGNISVDASIAYHLNKKPDVPTISIDSAALLSGVDLRRALIDYVHACSGKGGPPGLISDIPFDHLRVWFKFKIQLYSAHHTRVIMPAQTIQAVPPSNDAPLGRCDTVMAVKAENPLIVQVRFVFQAVPQHSAVLPPYLRQVLIYGQLFTFSGQHWDTVGNVLPEPSVNMFLLERCFTTMNGHLERVGEIFALSDVSRAVEITPVYGSVMDKSFDTTNSLESAPQFYLNSHSDKEIYHALYTQFV
jgi:hypothetical protein